MKKFLNYFKNRILDDKGAETLELVLCLPLLMLVLSYIVCFSQLFYAKQVALTAADIGTRIAITQTTSTSAKKEAREAALAYVSEAGMGITFKEDEMSYDAWKRGNICDYTVTVEIQTAMPMAMDGGFGKTQKVSASGHMMIERERD